MFETYDGDVGWHNCSVFYCANQPKHYMYYVSWLREKKQFFMDFLLAIVTFYNGNIDKQVISFDVYADKEPRFVFCALTVNSAVLFLKWSSLHCHTTSLYQFNAQLDNYIHYMQTTFLY